MQRPAPAGNVRSADAATETISATAILVGLPPSSICPGDCDGGWLEPSTYDLKKNNVIFIEQGARKSRNEN